MSTADDVRGRQALRRVGRRHPHVDNDHIRRLAFDCREKAIDVAGSADALPAEARGEGFAEERRIVRQDDPRGTTPLLVHNCGKVARTRVPSPRRDSTSSRPPAASTRSASPRRPVPHRGPARPRPPPVTLTTRPPSTPPPPTPPPAAPARAASPRRPAPPAGSAPPRPSSVMLTTRPPSTTRPSIRT